MDSASTGLIPDMWSTNPQQAASVINQGNYNEWRTNNMPLYQDLIDQMTWNNPSIATQGVTEAEGNVNAAFDSEAGQRQRTLGAFGVKETAAEKTSNDRSMDSSRATSVVDAANNTRTNLAGRDKLIGNAVISGGNTLLGQSTDAINSAAGMDASRVAANAQAENERNQKAIQNIFNA